MEPVSVTTQAISTTAPAVGDEEMSSYKAIIDDLESDGVTGVVKEILTAWYAAVEAWYNLPVSTGTLEVRHKSNIGIHKELHEDVKSVLKPLVPREFILIAQREFIGNHVSWEHDQKVAHCAGHLSWYVGELLRGREPIERESLDKEDWAKLNGEYTT